MKMKLFTIIIIVSVILVSGCIQQTETSQIQDEGTKSAELTPQKLGEIWWKDIFRGDWDTLFNDTVDENSNTLSPTCQSEIKTAYTEFVGTNNSIKVEDNFVSCTNVTDSPLPIPSSDCIAVKYSLETNSRYSSSGYLFFVKIGNEWRVQINCGWYSSPNNSFHPTFVIK